MSRKFVLAKFKFPIPAFKPRPNGKPPGFACIAAGRVADVGVSPVVVVAVVLADVDDADDAVESVLGARITK